MSKTTNRVFSGSSLPPGEDGLRLREGTSAAVGCGDFDRDQDWLHGAVAREWVKKAEADSGTRAGLPSEVAEKVKS